MWRAHSHITRRSVLCMLGLMIMLSWSVAHHIVDIDPSHHAHHQCELFSASQFGFAHDLPQLPELNIDFIVLTSEPARKLQRLYFAYLARSPAVK
ncbi:DUF2607 family protein, partial [Vibrio sp. D173a]|uniref:DUF2607 family protein n=1 Tax=Vibrio sp. D173a TaxID=2836349 RepID=UPI0035C672F9